MLPRLNLVAIPKHGPPHWSFRFFRFTRFYNRHYRSETCGRKVTLEFLPNAEKFLQQALQIAPTVGNTQNKDFFFIKLIEKQVLWKGRTQKPGDPVVRPNHFRLAQQQRHNRI